VNKISTYGKEKKGKEKREKKKKEKREKCTAKKIYRERWWTNTVNKTRT
jgi:hypothetical protein